MKRSLTIFFLVFSFWQLSAQELNVMSFNIRLNIASDSLNAWPYRKDKVASQILFHQTHLLGVQEALHNQMMDLQAQLKAYRYVGVGRADGKEQGEYSAIFFDTTRLELLETETFWLAEQTQVPGMKGWDAAIERIVTWAKFRDRKSRKVFYHFNTHFDHMGKEARKQSAKLILAKVKEIAGNHPVIVTGDFNAQPNDEPIKILTDSPNRDKLIDAKSVSQQP
ncbi:MAG TPA: endonuclease/exonuclease/phosphatase family protein, partial [Flavisolibacter sp.]